MIAGIQGHMSILLHEGSHYLLHPNRQLNELLADASGMPLLFTARNYRTIHLAHHEHSGDPLRDPERQIYKGQSYNYSPSHRLGPVVVMLLRDLFFINAWNFLTGVQKHLATLPGHAMLTRHEGLRGLAILGLPLVAAGLSGVFWEYVLLWYGTLFTLTFFFLKLHIYGEHTGKQGPTEFERTWHHQPNPVFDFFVYPIRSGFHLEHHMYPSVPWHRMASFHGELMKLREWQESQALLNSDGYFFGRNTIWRNMLRGKKIQNQMSSSAETKVSASNT
jgi:fatty acid desaturase